MFSLENVKHLYDQKEVVHVPHWNSEAGEHWLLLGSSGSGKTTLLHIMAGILRASEGKVVLAEQDISQFNASRLDKFRAQQLGLIFQKPHLIQTLTVLKNLQLAQFMAGLKSNKKRCYEVLDQLNILEKKNNYPNQLSEGQAQRLSVARAVLNKPDIILADEPTASVDDQNASQVIKLLKEQAEACSATLVIATHDQRVKAHFDKQYEIQ